MKALALRFFRILSLVAALVLAFWFSGRVIRHFDPTTGGVFDPSMLQAFVMALVPFSLAILCAHLVCSVLFTTLREWLGRKGLLADWQGDPPEHGSVLSRRALGISVPPGVGPVVRVIVFFSFFAFLCALYAFFVFCSVLLLLVPAS